MNRDYNVQLGMSRVHQGVTTSSVDLLSIPLEKESRVEGRDVENGDGLSIHISLNTGYFEVYSREGRRGLI